MSDHARMIDAFLDGQLSQPQQQAFLHLLRTDPALSAEFARQQSIEQILKRLYESPRPDEILRRLDQARLVSPELRYTLSLGRRPMRMLAAAALLAFSLGTLWFSWTLSRPPRFENIYTPPPWKSFETVYHDTVKDGFEPAWVCRNQAQFSRVFSRELRQPLQIAALPPGITAGGVAYSNTISTKTVNVLGRVNNVPVMVFVDHASAADKAQDLPKPKSLNMFESRVGQLVLYEVTPFDQPHLLPHFYKP